MAEILYLSHSRPKDLSMRSKIDNFRGAWIFQGSLVPATRATSAVAELRAFNASEHPTTPQLYKLPKVLRDDEAYAKKLDDYLALLDEYERALGQDASDGRNIVHLF